MRSRWEFFDDDFDVAKIDLSVCGDMARLGDIVLSSTIRLNAAHSRSKFSSASMISLGISLPAIRCVLGF